MTKPFYLLTAFGKDRPGIVAQVTGAVFAGGGNIEDASMTRLGGEFTVMMVLSLPDARAGEKFLKSLTALQRKVGLHCTAKLIRSGSSRAAHRPGPTHLISVYGTDRPGIVYHVAHELFERGVNITDLNTQVLERSGKPLYVMLLEARMPSNFRAAALNKTLARLGRRLGLKVTLQDIDPVVL